MHADIILKNANVITMDAGTPSAQLAAISGDKIAFAGGTDALESVSGAKTRVIDCGGRTVIPGFNDAHLHFFSLVQKLLSIDLSPPAVSSIADIKEAIRRRAARTPPGDWLRGTNYNEFYLAEKHCPTRRDLDEAAPGHPVIITHRSLHACVLNSRALSLAGITSETPEPPGTRIERDIATGEPNGILLDMFPALPPFTGAEFAEGVSLLNRQLLSYGITSFQEATYKTGLDRWQTIKDFKDSGKLKSRVTMMTGPGTRRQFQEAGMTTGAGDNQLKLGAVKILLGETGGQLDPPQEEVNRIALDGHLAGFQLAFHAVARSHVEGAVRALEYVSRRSGAAGRRHRIEHCGECPPGLLERIKKLGCVIVTQPPFIYYSGERYLATVAKSRLPWLYRIKAPLESGVIVAGSSDAPVVPANPLAGIYAAVTRKAESGQTLLPEEAISPRQALALYTINAAYASFEEDIKGSIAPGKLADIVMLSDDPAKVPPEQIKDIRVEMTIIGGEVVWES